MKKLSILFFFALLLFGVKLASADEGKICTLEYAPVCGENGQTYGNKCQADDVAIAYEGECRSEEVKKCNIQCFRYDPVCGENGQTFACGQAEADCNGVISVKEGECGSLKVTASKKKLSCAYSDKAKQHLCLMLKEKGLFENYLRVNISSLSPEKAVLGGKFYVTKITWQADRKAIVEYEDGHIALIAATQMAPVRLGKEVVGGRSRYFKILGDK